MLFSVEKTPLLYVLTDSLNLPGNLGHDCQTLAIPLKWVWKKLREMRALRLSDKLPADRMCVLGIPVNPHPAVQIAIRQDPLIIIASTVKGIQFQTADLLRAKRKNPSFWKYRSYISFQSSEHTENRVAIFWKSVVADFNFHLTSTCNIIYCW